MSSIFIQIASYHDFELPKTIINAVKQKSGNNKITFGVFNCYYEFNDIYIPDVENLSIIEKKAPDGIGVSRSRSIANSLYNGEDYYLQIDAHTRFEKNWDEYLISEIQRFQDCGIKKPILTTYPGIYSYNNELNEVIIPGQSVSRISVDDIPGTFSSSLIPGQGAFGLNGSVIQKSISAGFIFTIGEFAKINFNEKIMFWGEEILTAARAWTRGFDLLMPSKQILYHLYYDQNSRMQKSNRRHVWKDFPDIFYANDKISKDEIKDIFTSQRISEDGLGAERSLSDFECYTGLNFKDGTIVDT
jgi:hypothetical protein